MFFSHFLFLFFFSFSRRMRRETLLGAILSTTRFTFQRLAVESIAMYFMANTRSGQTEELTALWIWIVLMVLHTI